MLTGKLALFIYGTLFGSAGFKLLGSKDARKLYAQAAAAALRCKEELMRNVETVQASCSDILAEAREINARREAAEAAELIEDAEEAAAE